MTGFTKTLKRLIETAQNEYVVFQSAIDEVSKYVRTKYPEVIAEYMPSDGGITFIGLDGTDVAGREFYSVEDLQNWLGKR